MFSGWGIRTLSADAPCGRTTTPDWRGLPGDGLVAEAERLFASLLEAALDFEHQRLPECFAGYARAERLGAAAAYRRATTAALRQRRGTQGFEGR